jgi:hypothetical protein
VPGTLGGLAGADAACQDRARAAGLPGTFQAWLSTSSVDAKSRFAAARGWIRRDGRPFADSVSALVDGQVYFPPRLDELGNDLTGATGDAAVATGTEGDGTHSVGNTSLDWTSTTQGYASGDPSATNEEWMGNHGSREGTLEARLYCFGVDHATPLAITPTPGRLAFLSQAPFVPPDEAAADTLCNMEAHNNGRTGNFVALLSTRSKPAAMLFDLGGPTWVRIDGVPWLERAPELAQGNLLTALNVGFPSGSALPQYVSYALAWTGSVNPGTASPTGAQCCNDWSGPTSTGTVGWAHYSNGVGFLNSNAACDGSTNVHLYCLEQ